MLIIKQADEAKEAFLKYYNPKASQKNKLSEENENKAANAYINQKLKIYSEKIEKLKESKPQSLLLKTMQLYNSLFKIKALFSKYKERTDIFISKKGILDWQLIFLAVSLDLLSLCLIFPKNLRAMILFLLEAEGEILGIRSRESQTKVIQKVVFIIICMQVKEILVLPMMLYRD